MPAPTNAVFALSGIDPAQVVARLSSVYPSASPTASPPWTLTHTLHRAVSGSTTGQPPSGQKPSYLHILQLSSHPNRTFLCTSSSETAGTHAIAIPQGGATAEFRRLLQDRFGASWQPVRQGDMQVAAGVGWEVGVFRVQVGELLRDRGAGGGVEKRATLVAVDSISGDDIAEAPSSDPDDNGMILSEFCTDLGFTGSQPDTNILTECWGRGDGWTDETDLWCQMLRKLSLGGPASRIRLFEQDR